MTNRCYWELEEKLECRSLLVWQPSALAGSEEAPVAVMVIGELPTAELARLEAVAVAAEAAPTVAPAPVVPHVPVVPVALQEVTFPVATL